MKQPNGKMQRREATSKFTPAAFLRPLPCCDRRIEELFESHPDAELFAALPGAGPQLAPRLLVAFGEDRERFGSVQDLLRYSGIAPVKESCVFSQLRVHVSFW